MFNPLDTRIALLLFCFICMIPAYLFRKRISYLFCPDSIIGHYVKYRIFFFYNLLPSIFLAGIIIMNLRDWLGSRDSLKPYENYSLILGLIALQLFLFISGLITNRILYLSHNIYKEWKDKLDLGNE
jgi:hypothetical protein